MSGYRKHLRRKEPTCTACKVAWRLYYRKRNQERRKEKAVALAERKRAELDSTESE